MGTRPALLLCVRDSCVLALVKSPLGDDHFRKLLTTERRVPSACSSKLMHSIWSPPSRTGVNAPKLIPCSANVMRPGHLSLGRGADIRGDDVRGGVPAP